MQPPALRINLLTATAAPTKEHWQAVYTCEIYEVEARGPDCQQPRVRARAGLQVQRQHCMRPAALRVHPGLVGPPPRHAPLHQPPRVVLCAQAS